MIEKCKVREPGTASHKSLERGVYPLENLFGCGANMIRNKAREIVLHNSNGVSLTELVKRGSRDMFVWFGDKRVYPLDLIQNRLIAK